MVRLDARQHLGLGRVRVDLRGSGRPRRVVGGQLLVADGQDVVGGQAVERAQRDELVELLAAEREVVAGARAAARRARRA